MLSNLKVRTGILLVLGTFLLALLVSNGAAWFAMYSSNDKLDRVNSVYSNQVTPVYEAYTLLQRLRLDLGAAVIDLQEGRLRESEQSLGRARSAEESAGKSMAAFSKIEKSPELQEKASAVQSAYQRYASQSNRQAEALGRQDIRGFIEQNASIQSDGVAFDEAVSAYLKYVDARTDQLVVDAGNDYILSKTVSIALLVISVLLSALCWIFVQRGLLRPLNHAGQHFDRIAAGDLTARVEVRNSNEIGQLFGALKRMQENLARTVSQVRRGVDEINVGSREISAGNTDLSSRTEQQAASLEETAASMEELASTVKQNADNARQANQ
ncbi:MAG TPA: Tar ligand binding domain-containing protein, partial [Bordetella sp.]|nr:Tar ligand binding domain-containing protein [Bordetella sp.]